MRARVTDRGAIALPSGEVAQPGDIIETETCGLSAEVIEEFFAERYIEDAGLDGAGSGRVPPPVKPRDEPLQPPE